MLDEIANYVGGENSRPDVKQKKQIQGNNKTD
jgi:hypothetical protein